MSPRLQAGLAGGAAATVWGLVEPIDRRLFRFPYSDIAILGKFAMLTDRFHPARGAPELPPMSQSGRAFAQATFRHLLLGVVLGLLVSI